METTILNFIKHFQTSPDVITCFTNGNCYWFSFILSGRFPEGEVMYDSIINHFGYRINNRIYDITGDVTNKYNWEIWADVYLRDRLHGNRIFRDCIDFEERKDD